MRKGLFLLIILFCSNLGIIAQEKDDEIETVFKNGGKTHHGFYFAPQIKLSNFDKEVAFFTGLRGAWVINRSVAIGFEGNGLIPTIAENWTIPFYRVRPLAGYGGIFVEPILKSNKVAHITLPILFGAGWAGYIEDWEGNIDPEENVLDEHVFWVIEPAINVELNVTKFFRLAAGVSYRFTQDLELINTNKSALQGVNYNFMLKFGKF